MGERDGAARERAVAWARAVAADEGAVFLDTETTGLGGGAEVIDIGVVGVDGTVLFETLVRPVTAIPADASAVHGLFDGDVADAPTWSALHDRLCGLLEGRRVVVYNASFDRGMIGQCCERHGLVMPGAGWECAMRAYAEFRGERTAAGTGFRLQKLELAVASFGGRGGQHRATADARACRAVVLGMATATEVAREEGAFDPW